jgi:hypothetical protein
VILCFSSLMLYNCKFSCGMLVTSMSALCSVCHISLTVCLRWHLHDETDESAINELTS